MILCTCDIIYRKNTDIIPNNADERLFPKTTSYSEFDNSITEDIDNTINSLKEDFEKISNEINTYIDYKNNIQIIKEFYNKIDNEVTSLSERIERYCFKYSSLILYSDNSFNNKYYEFNDLFNCLYINSRSKIYDQIYIEILSDIYDKFYNGILNDAQNEISWEEWTKIRSDEYSMWSTTHSKIYDVWFNLGYKIYNFTSDIQEHLSNNNIEAAYDLLESYEQTIQNKNKD